MDKRHFVGALYNPLEGHVDQIDARDADAVGDEPVWHGNTVVGCVTSGGFGHCVNRSIALAYIPAPLAEHTDGFEVEILGERRPAQRVAQALYDPSGERCALPDVRQSAFSIQQEANPMRSIPVGAKGSFVLVVTPDHLANRFKDAMLPPVLATPIMIMMMENAALNAIKPYLDANQSALGTRVDVRHLAATPAGRSVTANAEVTKVDGRHIEFRIDAKDGTEQIGVGIHERMIIDLARFTERLKSKFA